MCGRFGLNLPVKTIAEFFMTLNLKEVKPRYNIAPTQEILGVIRTRESQQNLACSLHWGLVPGWARDMKMAAKLTNARCETLAEKPSFRGAYRYRRCLIPASGFYEWKKQGSTKQPYYISPTQPDRPLAFAGLWEHWSGPMGEEIMSGTIITTEANDVMAPLHHRMPVILEQDQFPLWLDPSVQDTRQVQPLLKPCPNDWLQTRPVSRYVGNSRNEGPRCLDPPEAPAPPKPDNGQMSLF